MDQKWREMEDEKQKPGLPCYQDFLSKFLLHACEHYFRYKPPASN